MSSPWDAPSARQKPKDDLDRSGENITKLVQNVAQMKKLVVDMGTPRDSANLRMRLKQTREQTTQLAGDTLKLLQGKFDQSDPAVKRRYTKLMETYKQTVADFQSVERQYIANEKQFAAPAAQPQIRTDNPLRSPTGRTPLNPMGSPPSAEADVQLQMVADSAASATRTAIQAEKEQELRAAAKDMQELNEMMKDINIMLEEQGVMVDTVEKNTSDAADNTAAGAQDLGKAREYLNSYRCKCAIIWTIVILVVAAIVVGITVPLVRQQQTGGGTHSVTVVAAAVQWAMGVNGAAPQ